MVDKWVDLIRVCVARFNVDFEFSKRITFSSFEKKKDDSYLIVVFLVGSVKSVRAKDVILI